MDSDNSTVESPGSPFLEGIGLLKEMNSANVIVIVSIVSASVVLLLIAIVIGILVCRRGARKPTEKYGHNTKSSPDSGYPNDDSHLLEQKAFYENLPFHGLNPPGKKSVGGGSGFDPEPDDMIYADTDYKDLYDFGPVSYHAASKEAAVKTKDERDNRIKTAISYNNTQAAAATTTTTTSNGTTTSK